MCDPCLRMARAPRPFSGCAVVSHGNRGGNHVSIWPNLFIAGAPKCGTSSLHAYLQDVPGVYMSRIKEPNFFSRIVIPDDHVGQPIRDERQYLRLFENAGDARIRGESSPTYLRDPEAPYLIDRTVPAAKVIVSLRDPVERLYSHYLMQLNNNAGLGSFMDEIRKGLASQDKPSLPLLWADTGLYSEQVRRYREVFGDERFKVLIFEEFTSNVPGTLQQVLEFIGIEHRIEGMTAAVHRQHSEARGPLVRYLFGNRTISRAAEKWIPSRARKLVREKLLVRQVPKPQMEDEARKFLIGFYAEDVRRLSALLGRPLPWRNFVDAH